MQPVPPASLHSSTESVEFTAEELFTLKAMDDINWQKRLERAKNMRSRIYPSILQEGDAIAIAEEPRISRIITKAKNSGQTHVNITIEDLRGRKEHRWLAAAIMTYWLTVYAIENHVTYLNDHKRTFRIETSLRGQSDEERHGFCQKQSFTLARQLLRFAANHQKEFKRAYAVPKEIMPHEACDTYNADTLCSIS